MRELSPSEGFLPLPKVDLLLYKAPGASSPAVDALHDYLAHYVGLSGTGAAEVPNLLPKVQQLQSDPVLPVPASHGKPRRS
jgi:hypothetical protein